MTWHGILLYNILSEQPSGCERKLKGFSSHELQTKFVS